MAISLLAKLQGDGVNRSIRTRIGAGSTLSGSTFTIVEQPGVRDDLWVFLPAVQSPRRLLASNQGDAYFGSEFRYGDLIQITPADYDVTSAGEQTIGGTPCWGIQLTPKSPITERNTGLGKQLLWLGQHDALERRVEQFDRSGTLFKIMDVGDWKPVTHDTWFPATRHIRNLESGGASHAAFSDIEATTTLSDLAFSPQHMTDPF